MDLLRWTPRLADEDNIVALVEVYNLDTASASK